MQQNILEQLLALKMTRYLRYVYVICMTKFYKLGIKQQTTYIHFYTCLKLKSQKNASIFVKIYEKLCQKYKKEKKVLYFLCFFLTFSNRSQG